MIIKIPFSRRPLFWILLSAMFLGGIVFSIKYFAKAFPIINLDISMNRKEALLAAQQLAQKYAWGPKGFEQTASFSTDEMTKNFIELEGGGKKMLNTIIAEKQYALYTWNVRHFKEHETHEITIAFTPEGTPYEFQEKIPENEPGAALTPDKARAIALQTAQRDWHIDFTPYIPIENSQEARQNGRIDHIFVYERTDKKIGEAPYRLRLEVSGDRLTELSFFVKIPEAFTRRYEHMRSANDTIAQIAGVIMILLYFLGGCLIGLFFLARRRWIIWSKPFLWSSFIGILAVLNNISQFPLLWMNYDTALSKSTIYLKFILGLFSTFGATTIWLGLIFAAAESLTRMAFTHQPQLWKLWSSQAASSIQTLGRTVGGYLIVGFDFAFVVAMYFFASRFLGWWTPSSELIDPNILATYFPWLYAITKSLNAGFMEECLFRAIPLSCAAIIGKKYGNRTAWISGAFILQVVIFSAVHANYPAQPAYARLVELLIPSSIFGGIYLIFGLLPAIISHFVFDVIGFALPIFLSDMLLDKLLVILLASTPLLIVIFMRLKTKHWSELSKKLYNAAWQPPTTKIVPLATPPQQTHKEPHLSAKKLITLGSILGLALWLLTTQFKQDGLPLQHKKYALTRAEEELKEKNIALKTPWQQFPIAQGTINEQHRFVWKTNKLLYQKLLDAKPLEVNYLAPAQWKIRYAQFQGDLTDRAEEYNLFISQPITHVSPVRIAHQLPESHAGATLSEQEARKIAHDFLKTNYFLEPTKLTEISAISQKRPARLDWLFTFSDPAAYPTTTSEKNQGQARSVIEIAGDEVADYYSYIFVPEEWLRTDHQQQTTYQLLMSLCLILLSILLVLTGLRAIIAWVHKRYETRIFLLFFIALLSKSIIQFFNLLPLFLSSFKTSEPFSHQLITLTSSLAMTIIFYAAGFALLAGFIQQTLFFLASVKSSLTSRCLLGISIGTIIAGCTALIEKITPAAKPLWADYSSAAAYIPSLSIILMALTNYIKATIILYIIIKTIDYATRGGTTRLVSGALACISFGIILQGAIGIDDLWSWLLLGITYGILLFLFYIFTLRFDRSIIPFVTGTMYIFELLQQILFHAFPGAILGNIGSIIFVILLACWWSNILDRQSIE